MPSKKIASLAAVAVVAGVALYYYRKKMDAKELRPAVSGEANIAHQVATASFYSPAWASSVKTLSDAAARCLADPACAGFAYVSADQGAARVGKKCTDSPRPAACVESFYFFSVPHGSTLTYGPRPAATGPFIYLKKSFSFKPVPGM